MSVAKEAVFDAVFDSQRSFRALLEAMSRPGTIVRLPVPEYHSTPAGLLPHSLTVALTLCDTRVTLGWILPASADEELWREYFTLNLSSPIVDEAHADFVICAGGEFRSEFSTLRVGEPEYPEHGATAIVQVAGFHGAAATPLGLSGPGIDGATKLPIDGLDRRLVDARNTLCREYPIGIDLFFLAPSGEVASIPRSTIVRVEV